MGTRSYGSFVGARPAIEHLIVFEEREEMFDMGLLMSEAFSPIALDSLRVAETMLDSPTIPLQELEVFHPPRSISSLFSTHWLNEPLRLGNLRSITIVLDDHFRDRQADFFVIIWWINNFRLSGLPGCVLERVTLRVGRISMLSQWKELDGALKRVKSLKLLEVEIVSLGAWLRFGYVSLASERKLLAGYMVS
ncbi:uncharacterized protein BT62DRAFT_924814 [Guyanagaster necrorhizus]|uniref:Uncharacterized protein n=1 Tax=Guyanagaster necrorhizus TaxID=856835 RepID=A0A9P8AL17_9AGAR|nr:uncharacterized protein BT62DRAFT_924814 [Guyanagaster necrorhizus MCA 3950]KAG7439295.1 hypothetical protein BT62DRAFT_924814 [Guyanagaster necrorhizus MCA 3950]